MKILMVIGQYYPVIGGAEKQCQLQAEELVKRGHYVRVLTGRWTKSKRNEIINGVEIMRLDNLYSLFGINRLANISFCLVLFFYLVFSLRKFQIVHIHQALRPAIVSLAALFFIKRPCLIKIANSGQRNDYKVIKYGWENSLDRALKLHKLYRRADKFVALNSQIYRELIEEGVAREKIEIVPNGVRCDTFMAKKDFRRHDPFSLVYVGRVTKHKGIEILFQAIKGMQGLKLEIFGKLNNDGYWQNILQGYNLDAIVDFRGLVDNLTQILADNDLFILPSSVEGMSNAFLEAMAIGLPCIVTDIPANIEVISDNNYDSSIPLGAFRIAQCACLVNKFDTVGLKKAIEYLLENQDKRQDLGRKASDRIRNLFSISGIVDKYSAIYGQITKNG